MPEGSEVKIVGDWLRRRLAGRCLGTHGVISGRYSRHSQTRGLRLLYAPGDLIEDVQVRGKLLVIRLVGAYRSSILCTLAMTGGWSNELTKYSRVRFDVLDEPPVYFNDIRNFGTLTSATPEFTEKRLQRLGLDPLARATGLNFETFLAMLDQIRHRRPNLRLAEFLLDQRYVCGIGNYGRAEILYEAELSPWITVNQLGVDGVERLRLAINAVQWASYCAGGASLSSWYSPDGTRGTFQEQFKVYGRSECPAGNTVDSALDFNGRRMWWIPAVQGLYQSGQCS